MIITAHAEISGSVVVGENSWIGPNVSIREKLKIGRDSLVGIGSVVVKNIDNIQHLSRSEKSNEIWQQLGGLALHIKSEIEKLILNPTKDSLKLFNNRLSTEITYYKTENTNLIAENFRASYGTGFVLNTLNVGSNENTGLEIVLDYVVVAKKDFTWNTRMNFNRMRNKVTSLPSNVPEFYISDTWVYSNARGGLVNGGPTTTITSYGYARNTAGQILINPTTGIPLLENVFKVRGDRNPDFTIGWLNNITYKDLRLSFLWDIKVGGDIFNATDRYLTTIGRSNRTAMRFAEVIVDGVLKDGKENTATPTKNYVKVIPNNNYLYYSTMPEEAFIEKDINWFRLRDISLSYNLKKHLKGSLAKYAKSLSAFVTVNDLILITNYSGADPAVGANSAASRGVSGFGFDYGNMGAPVSFNVGFRTSF